MNKQKFIIIISLLLFCTAIYAQDGNKAKIGIGISTGDVKNIFRLLSSPADVSPIIYVPINVSATFRIEPEVGFTNTSEKSDYMDIKRVSTLNTFHFGVGIFPVFINYENYNVYFGGRIAYETVEIIREYTFASETDKNEENLSGFSFGPALGGEYLLSEYFSLGGEAQVIYQSLSGEDKGIDNNTNEKTDLDNSSFSTSVLIFFRFYF